MFYTRIIEVVRPFDGEVQSDVPTILAINPDKFFDDLTVLSNSKRFRVLKLPIKWQKLLLAIFWTSNISELTGLSNYYKPGDNKCLIEVQEQLRTF
jgi:hypothetical protein